MSKSQDTTNEITIHENNALTVAADNRGNNPAVVYIASLTSKHSQRNMTRYLNQIAELLQPGIQDATVLNWSSLRFQPAAIRAQLSNQYAPATVNGMLSALRGVLKSAWNLGLMSAEDYHRAASVKTVKGETLPAGRDLKQGEILSLANVCIADKSPAGVRDAAIIAVLYTCALRRAEVINLDLDHFDPDSGQIKVISGKRRKDRTVYATNGTLDVIMDWIAIRGRELGALFTPINKGGNIQHRRMTSQAIYNVLRKRAAEANVTDFSPHDFRRTFAGDMLDRGVDIVTGQKLMGHASVNTTGRYDRRPEEAKKQAAQKLHFPYSKNTMPFKPDQAP